MSVGGRPRRSPKRPEKVRLAVRMPAQIGIVPLIPFSSSQGPELRGALSVLHACEGLVLSWAKALDAGGREPDQRLLGPSQCALILP